jgi:hypothetical protein
MFPKPRTFAWEATSQLRKWGRELARTLVLPCLAWQCWFRCPYQITLNEMNLHSFGTISGTRTSRTL